MKKTFGKLKKLTAGLVIAGCLFSYAGMALAATPGVDFMYGDLNGDKKITTFDYALLRNYTDYGVPLTIANWQYAADLNLDGQVDKLDTSILRGYVLGMIKTIPLKK